jgi:hypothetical protein
MQFQILISQPSSPPPYPPSLIHSAVSGSHCLSGSVVSIWYKVTTKTGPLLDLAIQELKPETKQGMVEMVVQ